MSVGECEGEDVSVVRGRREEGGGGGEGSGESTAEEGDVIPNESSTTTDTLPEPIDFIDAGHSIPRAYSTSVLPLNGTAHAVIAPASLQVQYMTCTRRVHVHVHVYIHVQCQ